MDPDRANSSQGRLLRILRTAIGLALLTWLSVADFALAGGIKGHLRFGAEMARLGNWREARYRWEIADREQPNNPRVLNNLAVAMEALGEPERARHSYEKSMTLAGNDERIEHNLHRFVRFWRSHGVLDGDGDVTVNASAEPAEAASPVDGKGKTVKVTVRLPVPARLDVSEDRSLLVASFLSDDSAFLDINRELVRFLRGEFRKQSGLEVLPVTPAPAVPEQTLEDLIANDEFWKHLGREYVADLIVSGLVKFQRYDASGFQDVDVVSSATGQKVRSTQFVEQERFEYEIDIIFMDGGTGELRFRDRLQRSALYRGSQNDPISAFYELSESIAADVLAIVQSRSREDMRFIFKS